MLHRRETRQAHAVKKSLRSHFCEAEMSLNQPQPPLVDTNPGNFKRIDSQDYDISSPREWLEFHEARNNGKGGAYTVVRCDLIAQSEWRIWGKKYHVDRLLQSFQLLEGAELDKQAFELTQRTNSMMVSLLEAMSDTLGETRCTVMVTFLWQLEAGGHLFLRGHAFSSGQNTFQVHTYHPVPMVASLAISKNPFPNRYSNLPRAKCSAWCLQRRPLEETFKTDGVGEVLLMDSTGSRVLEGLTSNVFFLYKDGVLRTPDADVLEGYARSLVLRAADTIDLTVETRPILASESEQWEEVFVTSSIRLVAPVSKIVSQDSALWSATPKQTYPLWRTLFEAMFRFET